MLKQRVITAIILLIVLVGSIYLSPLAFAAVMTFAVAAAIWEWLRMLGVRAALPVAAVMGIVLYALWWVSSATGIQVSVCLLRLRALWRY